MTLDVTFNPHALASKASRDGAASIRVYESGAVPGMVSVVLYESEGFPTYKGGTRLTRAQVSALCQSLDAFLAANPTDEEVPE